MVQKTQRKRKPTAAQSTVKVAASGTTIRFEQPKSNRQRKPSTAQIIVEEIHPFEGFTGFLREYAVVGLSIGFIFGTQISSLVKIIVASLIVPLTQLFFGGSLDSREFSLHFHSNIAKFYWGSVVDGLIQLLFLLIFVYIIFRWFNLDKLSKPQIKK